MNKIIKMTILLPLVFISSLYANKIVGSLEPYSKTTIKSETEGIIKKINYKIGNEVEKNILLVKIEDSDYLLEYKMAVANEELSKINYEFLKADFQRYNNLLKSKSITSQMHADKKKLYQQAKLENKISSINTSQIKRKLEKTEITSIYTGVISNKFIEIGDYVTTGDSLLEIVDTKKLNAVFYILQNDYKNFNLKDEVSLNIPDLNNKKLKAKISLIAPTITENNSGYRMEILLDNKNKELKANFEIELLLNDKRKED